MDPQLGWGTGGKASPWMKLQSSCSGGKTIFPSHAKPLLGKATSPSGAPLGVISPAPALQVAEGVENSQNASNFCWIPDIQGEDLGAAPRLRSIQLPSQTREETPRPKPPAGFYSNESQPTLSASLKATDERCSLKTQQFQHFSRRQLYYRGLLPSGDKGGAFQGKVSQGFHEFLGFKA